LRIKGNKLFNPKIVQLSVAYSEFNPIYSQPILLSCKSTTYALDLTRFINNSPSNVLLYLNSHQQTLPLSSVAEMNNQQQML
jgi:hypothetical protein